MLFLGCVAKWSHVAGINPTLGTQRGLQDRGTNTTVKDFDYYGNGRAFYLASKQQTYGFDYQTNIVGCDLTKDAGYGGSQTCFDLFGTSTDKQTLTIQGGNASGMSSLVSPPTDMTDLEILICGGFRSVDAGRLSISTNQKLTLDGYTRRVTSGSVERVLVNGDGSLDLLNYTVDLAGAADLSSLVLAQGAGSASIFVGNAIVNKLSDGFKYIADDGTNTPSVFWGKDKVTATSVELAAASDRVNTLGKWEGKMVFDSTLNRPVYSTGTGTTSAWNFADGTPAVTPS